jgi:hypothetical protein
MSNAYLLHLTNGERNLRWLWVVLMTWLLLWVVSCILIELRFLEPSFIPICLPISVLGLPLGILVIAVFLVFFVFTGAQLTYTETQKEQFELIYLTNVSTTAIFWSLVLGTIYRVRYWFPLIIGIYPYLLWLGCQSYAIFWALPPDLRSYTTFLGNTYTYHDGAIELMRQLEVFWFMSLTTGLLGLSLLSILCCVAFTMKSKKAVLSAAGVMAFILPFALGLIVVVTPEGFLLADTAYGNAAVSASFAKIHPVGIAIAVVPLVASLGAQHLMQLWAFK